MSLTDIVCKTAKPEAKSRKLSDGAGLYLEVMPNGSKYWRLKYRYSGKEKRLAFGVYPEVSLKEAREKRDEARKTLADGQDPSQLKKQKKLTQYISSNNSFEIIAREWHTDRKSAWTERHATYVLRRLEADIFPILGFKAVQDITAPELLAALKKIESRGAVDIAKRALQTTGQVFRYAIATGRAERDISSDLKGALKTRKKENYSYLEARELPDFLSKLENYDGELQTKLAFKLLLLTFVRTGELRGAKWEEIDLEKNEWRIPAERMKMRTPHIVPLSTQAISILKELEPISGHREHIFPNRNKPMTCISENTILYAIYRMGYHSRATPHGFRATASTILNEHSFHSDVIELQLAHAERNKVRASYNHAQRLTERRAMMQWWADYLASLSREDNVTLVNFQKTA
ncbi:MAG: tyrosine-type recombinase/integrase [Alphaproteobacteria bacterium]|nr:tyrosine-type recombinase/integrase [Alphaproteobacteria bacterium]NCQ66483.1 tyrosine-type recombinase/integrase [Alphaproteobacteria bacterium]